MRIFWNLIALAAVACGLSVTACGEDHSPDGPTDPRLLDEDFEWARLQGLEADCASCHRGSLTAEQMPEDCLSVEWCLGAPSYWDLDFGPIWTDSAEDHVLRSLAGGWDPINEVELDPALPTETPERFRALIDRELERRAEARGDEASEEVFRPDHP